MNKSYTEQLAEWVKKKHAVKKRDRNLVMFQAVKDDVCEAISAGYSIRTVWENMYETKRVTIGYHQFLKYTNQVLKKANQTPPKQNTTQLVPKKGAKPPERPNPSNQQKPQNFKFDPSPNKEDWL
ncbi:MULTISPECIES: TraK family protein [Methylomonas]|jgi:hypothetical protein|uniref:TraK n=2 Tax=Methylomonas TaxID=416 RepID=A0A177M4Q8_METMH|nr:MULTISPECIES: TraK family protein [Methylomonas]MBD9363809.1 TraK family protein [Methylomonas fluvii]OAI00621.1 hypothetical protein A1353_19475 [Methylomonas methanica]OAI06723.1 hypothetical protein A1332_10710 [Methylomonas methanica]CAD6877122.1 hypothetical protein [Methylomonas fluvii]